MAENKEDASGKREELQEQIADELPGVMPHLGREGESKWKIWFLLSGDRWRVATVLLVGIFGTIFVLGLLFPEEILHMFREMDTVQTLFNTLLNGVILLVSIVVSINSIALTQQLASLRTQEERVEASLQFRRDLMDLTEGDEAPTNPADFLGSMLEEIADQAAKLQGIAAASGNDEFQEAVRDCVENDIFVHIDRINRQLGDPPIKLLDVLLAGLSYNYAEQIQFVHRMRHRYEDLLSDDDLGVVDELVKTLEFFAVGHRYFQTLYYKQETSNLSKELLYTALPAILFTSITLLVLDAGFIPEAPVFPISPFIILVSVAYAVLLVPFIILTVYILRLATVTQRTLSGPFLVKARSPESIDWEDIDTTTE